MLVVMICESLVRSKGRPGLRLFAPASSPELQDGLASLGSTQDSGQGKLVRSSSRRLSHDDDNDPEKEVLVVMIRGSLERLKGLPGLRPFAPASSPELQEGLASRSQGQQGLRPFAPASSPELQDGLAFLQKSLDPSLGTPVQS